MATETLDLKLDTDEEHPRRLVAFPGGQIVALGGDDSTLTCITRSQDTNNKKNQFDVRVIRQYDEASVRAIAVSSDGKRVALGFDNGSTKIYSYDDFDASDASHHPFIPNTNAEGGDDDEEADNGFLSQPDLEGEEDTCWAGPQVEDNVRDLKFLPDSHWLVVASEAGLVIVNVESADTINDRYLEQQAEKEHDGGGVRGVAITKSDSQMMASLTMEGRLTLWKLAEQSSFNLESTDSQVPCLREAQCCIPSKDIGEANGAESSDRSCMPTWINDNVVALPGKTSIQLKEVSYINGSILVEESKETQNSDPAKGHIEPIVALASLGNFIVSSGRDSRVILWEMKEDKEELPTATFVKRLGQFDSIPTSFCWKQDTLFMACANGKLEIITSFDPKSISGSEKSTPATAQATKKSPVSKSEQKKSSKDVSVSPSASTKNESPEAGKFTFDDSEDEEDIDEKARQRLVGSPPKSKTLKADSVTEDTADSDDESFAPETQAPMLKASRSDSKDTDPLDSPAKEKANTKPAELGDDSDDESKASKTSGGDKVTGRMEVDSDEESVATPEEEKDEKEEQSPTDKDQSFKSKARAEKRGTSKRLMKQSKSTVDDDSDDEDEDLFKGDEVDGSTETRKKSKVSFIDDEAEDSNEVEEEDSGEMVDSPSKPSTESSQEAADGTSPAKTQNDNNTGNDLGGDQEDDDAGFPVDNDEDDSRADDMADPENFGQSYSGFSAPVLPEPQAAFAPSSTPLDLSRRFLCWNHVGSITLIHDEIGNRSSVDIDFTDKAFRRPVSFTDNQGFILGSLGDDGAIFATDTNEDDMDDADDELTEGLTLSARIKAELKKSQKQRMRKGSNPKGSSIYFHRFETFASLRDKDWHLTLPDGERVLGCACGQGWAAVATSRNFLRLFTSGGAQDQILWLPGNPVTVVGRGRFLAVFYHESMPMLDGTQKLGYMLYDAVASKTICKGPVACITSGSSLSWAGFSNDCSLMAMDSDGMLSMLIATSLPSSVDEGDSSAQATSWEWSPLLDTVGLRKSSEDSFWPITVFDGKLVCIPLKGGKQYPDAGRRPTTATIGLKMPFARPSTAAKSFILEELSVRSKMALTQKKVNNDIACGELMGDNFEDEYRTMCAQVDKVSLKLFASTVEAGKLERALDLVNRFHLEKSFDLAMKIAENHTKLVDFIEEARDARFPPEAEDDVYEEEEQQEEAYYDEPGAEANSSPPGRRMASSKISPDSSSTWKSSKRTFFGGQQERNVRARAF